MTYTQMVHFWADLAGALRQDRTRTARSTYNYITVTKIKISRRCISWRSRGDTHPIVSAGRLCVQQRLPGSLDGDRLVSTAAAVSALRAVTVPPVPGDKATDSITVHVSGNVSTYFLWLYTTVPKVGMTHSLRHWSPLQSVQWRNDLRCEWWKPLPIFF